MRLMSYTVYQVNLEKDKAKQTKVAFEPLRFVKNICLSILDVYDLNYACDMKKMGGIQLSNITEFLEQLFNCSNTDQLILGEDNHMRSLSVSDIIECEVEYDGIVKRKYYYTDHSDLKILQKRCTNAGDMYHLLFVTQKVDKKCIYLKQESLLFIFNKNNEKYLRGILRWQQQIKPKVRNLCITMLISEQVLYQIQCI